MRRSGGIAGRRDAFMSAQNKLMVFPGIAAMAQWQIKCVNSASSLKL